MEEPALRTEIHRFQRSVQEEDKAFPLVVSQNTIRSQSVKDALHRVTCLKTAIRAAACY